MRKSNNKLLSNAMAVILTAVIFLVSWKMILPSYADNKSKANVLKSEVDEAQNKIASIESAKVDLSGITDTINQLLVAIPEDKDEPNLISELEAIGTKNSIGIPSIEISSGASASATDTSTSLSAGTPVTVSFSVIGSADKISALTESLEKSIKFMNIKTITMTSQEGGDISASYSIETYVRGSANNSGEAQ